MYLYHVSRAAATVDSISAVADEYLDSIVKGPSATFAILFAISTGLYIYQNTKYKSWYLLWLLPCASTIFNAGFICREYHADHLQDDSSYTASQGLLFSGVPVLTASLYLVLCRFMAIQPHLSPFRPCYNWGVVSLLISTTISLTAQGTSTFFNPHATDSTIKSGLAILKAGVILMLFFGVAFVVVLMNFRRRFSEEGFEPSQKSKFKTVTVALYVSAALIVVRTIFRTVQLFSASSSPIWTTEAYFWVFDAVPMLISTMALNVCHPGRLLLT